MISIFRGLKNSFELGKKKPASPVAKEAKEVAQATVEPFFPDTPLADFPDEIMESNSVDLEVIHPIDPEDMAQLAPVSAQWISPQEKFDAQGLSIASGYFYTGSWSEEVSLDSERSMIDPALEISLAAPHEPIDRDATYLTMTPRQRGAYLAWLAGWRNDPEIDPALVLMFFHGMERHILGNVINNEETHDQLPAMVDELSKLLTLHGSIDRIDATELRVEILALLTLLSALEPSRKLNNEDFSGLKKKSTRARTLIKIAVAKACADAEPLPASLALAWFHVNPLVRPPTAALINKRCFDPLFIEAYQRIHGAGLTLQAKAPGLEVRYTPSSPSLKTRGTLSFTFDQLPNIAIDLKVSKKLQAVADEAAKPLMAYCKEVASAGGKVTARARLSLPVRFFPDSLVASLQEFHKKVDNGVQVFEVKSICKLLGLDETDFPYLAPLLAKALLEHGVGMEPDVLGGAKSPGHRDKFILFGLIEEFGLLDEKSVVESALRDQMVATLALELGCLLASADGDLEIREMAHLKEVVLSWSHLSENVKRRLIAHIRLLRTSPISLSWAKKRIEKLDEEGKHFCLDLVKSIAELDENIENSKMKSGVLEKLWESLA